MKWIYMLLFAGLLCALNNISRSIDNVAAELSKIKNTSTNTAITPLDSNSVSCP